MITLLPHEQREKHARRKVSFCLVAADPGWADGLILLGSPPAGLVLLSDITMIPRFLLMADTRQATP